MNFKELEKIYNSTLESIRSEEKDLSERQKGILLIVYLGKEIQTVRSLAESLKIPKAAVSRAVGTLEKYGFLRRMPDERDKRSIVIKRTVQGNVYLDNWNERLTDAK